MPLSGKIANTKQSETTVELQSGNMTVKTLSHQCPINEG